MSLAHGRPYLAIPGPSVMPEEVLRAMHRSAPNIYEGDLVALTDSLIPDLRRVARTEHAATFYIGNGHAAWEAALANVVAPGDRVLVPATGRFGHGWGDMAAGLGCDVQMIDFGKRSPFDLNRIEDALRADTDHRIKAVLASHVDTSSSVLNDIAGLRAALDMIHAEGIEAIWARHDVLARAIWAACDAWGQGGPLELNIADAAHRSRAVTALRIGAPHGTSLRKWTEHRAGVTLGIGLGMAEPGDPEWHGFFRIGHMGHVNAHMIMGALGAIQAGFMALDIPHGPGALEAAAGVMAQG